MTGNPTAQVVMEVVIVTSQRTSKLGVRAAQAAGAVLAGVLMSSCGQPAQDNNAGAVPGTGTNSESASETPRDEGGGTAPPNSSPGTGEQTSSEPNEETQESGGENATSGNSASGVDRCHTSMLSGSLEPGDPGAGQRYAELVLTNTSGETCTLYGYGGLQLEDSNGAPLKTDLTRDANPGPAMINLAPNQSASKTLHWSAVPHGGEPTDGPCQPEPSRASVIPPDETDPLVVEWGMGSVCGAGSISGTAYHQ